MNTEINPYKKVCKYKFCKKGFDAKRTNQEFCCKDHYMKHNNSKAKEIRDSTKKYDRILHKNLKLIKILKHVENVKIEDLKKIGFKIDHCSSTSQLKDPNLKIYYCYNYTLEEVCKNEFKILSH